MDSSVDPATAMKLLADEYKYDVIRPNKSDFLGRIFHIKDDSRFSTFSMT